MARPAGTKLAVASRHGITPPTLTRWSRTLTQAGLRLPLTPELAGEVFPTYPSGRGSNLARVWIAGTLGLVATAPVAAGCTSSVDARAVAGGPGRCGGSLSGVLAAVGPLPPHALHHAITRSRRFRSLPPIGAAGGDHPGGRRVGRRPPPRSPCRCGRV